MTRPHFRSTAMWGKSVNQENKLFFNKLYRIKAVYDLKNIYCCPDRVAQLVGASSNTPKDGI